MTRWHGRCSYLSVAVWELDVRKVSVNLTEQIKNVMP